MTTSQDPRLIAALEQVVAAQGRELREAYHMIYWLSYWLIDCLVATLAVVALFVILAL